MGRTCRRQNGYEWHSTQDEILKSGKWSIGNRTKYFGIKPKLEMQTLELSLMKCKKLGLFPKYSNEVLPEINVLGLIPYPVGALGLSP